MMVFKLKSQVNTYVMRINTIKFILVLVFLVQCYNNKADASQQNRTSHHVRKTSTDDYKVPKTPTYRSYQPVSMKYGNAIYVRPEDHPDYDITSYDAEYGGLVSNFTSSVYDDNPPLYPNPEALTNTNQVVGKFIENKLSEPDVDLPDDSLADADLTEHNVIDSVTYLYGYTNCQDDRRQYIILIFIASALGMFLQLGAIFFLMGARHTRDFRRKSKIYPIITNLCVCLLFCTCTFMQAIMGVSSQENCEKIALLLHYSHITCSMWILILAAAVTEYCVFETLSPNRFLYLFGYGIPAILVMFDFALSMEQYETKHYCWMSIEKGMVMGFMVPAMVFIIVNTALIIIGLQSVNRKQADILTARIEELFDYRNQNQFKNESAQMDPQGSVETLENYTGEHSRKNTDSSDSLDKEYDEDDNYVNGNGDGNSEPENETSREAMQDKSQLNILFKENLSIKWNWYSERNELKAYLNLCLILEPFFSINWVMGVVALENASHWSTPAFYLVLVLSMNVYLLGTVTTNMPIVNDKTNPTPPVCEEVVVEQQSSTHAVRITDSMPLLNPAVSQPSVTPAPADTISTISI